MASITGTMFMRTRQAPTSLLNGQNFISVAFFSIMFLFFNGQTELTIAVRHLRMPLSSCHCRPLADRTRNPCQSDASLTADHRSGNLPSWPFTASPLSALPTCRMAHPEADISHGGSVQVNGLPVFYKQRLRGLYPSWAYTAPGTYLRVYYSATEALIWSCIVYWLTGFAPDAGRQAFLSFQDDSSMTVRTH